MAAASVWAERVAAWRSSGLTSEEFAEKNGFNARSLLYWSSRLKRESRSKGKIRLARVVKAMPPAGGARDGAIEVVLRGIRVVVPPKADESLVRLILTQLIMHEETT